MTHSWVTNTKLRVEVCSTCGFVRRADDKNKPCRGPIKLRPLEKVGK